MVKADEGDLYLWDGVKGVEGRKLSGHSNGVQSAAFSPDGQWILTSDGLGISRVFDVATGKQKVQLKSSGPAGDYSAEVQLLALMGSRRGWNLGGAAFSPDCKLLALSYYGPVSLVELVTGKECCRLETSGSGCRFMAFSANGRYMVMGGDDVVRVCDVTEGKTLRGLTGHQGSVAAIAVAPKENVLATGGTDGTVRLWNIETGQQLRCFDGHMGGVEHLAFSADGKMVVSTGSDQCILVGTRPPKHRPRQAMRAPRKWINIGRTSPAATPRSHSWRSAK